MVTFTSHYKKTFSSINLTPNGPIDHFLVNVLIGKGVDNGEMSIFRFLDYNGSHSQLVYDFCNLFCIMGLNGIVKIILLRFPLQW
jgi:hypothetical protein